MTTNSPDVEILPLETPNPEKPAFTADAASLLPDASRCQHRFPNGTQCRFRGELQSGLCIRHFREKFVAAMPLSPSDSEDLSGDLLPELSEFSSGEDVQKFLARLVVQVTRGRVSPAAPPFSATSPTKSFIPTAPSTRKQRTIPSPSFSTSRAPSATKPARPQALRAGKG